MAGEAVAVAVVAEAKVVGLLTELFYGEYSGRICPITEVTDATC
jgi:hypothetical protein